MFSNYLKIALRNLKKYKGFTLINITGLAVGIACFIVLSLFILDELGYDSFNKNADRIYRVYVHSVVNGIETSNSKTAAPTGETLLRDFPEVENYTRIGYFEHYKFRKGDQVFRESGIYTADSSYFQIFSLPLLYGDANTALLKPNSLVMTETLAKKYFGDENPLGKMIQIEGRDAFQVTGVMRNYPDKSHFSCDGLLSSSTYPITQSHYWLDLWYTTYILLREGTEPRELEEKMQKTVLDNVGPQAEALLGIRLEQFYAAGNSYGFYLQPLTSIHLRSQRDYQIDLNTEWGDIKTSDIVYVWFFSAVAFFILLIAVINFINLATARSENRAKEVGIRKTVGSSQFKLVGQFIIESVLMCAIAVFIALVLVELVLPWFNTLIGKKLDLQFFNNLATIPVLILFTLVVGLLAGGYPAFYLAAVQPGQILKASTGRGSGKSALRSALVIIQFTISIALIIGTIVIKKQVNYIQNKDLGFKKDFLLSINNAGVLGPRMEEFKQQLEGNPGIISLTNGSRMFESGIPGNGYLYDKKSGTDPVSFQYLDVDYDFLKTFQIELRDGRFFSRDFSTDTNAVVINEAGVKDCHATDPVGKELTKIGERGSQTFTIIGVVKDFNYESLHREVRPLAFHLCHPRQPASILTVRVASQNLPATIKYIEETWNRFIQTEGCYYTFLEQNLANMYIAEQKTGIVTTVFSILAIFIACLGLFGLAAFVIEKRFKEIGIRKILGASPLSLLGMLAQDFAKWILLANVIAWPCAWYVMNKWLQNFAYRTETSWWIFILATGLVLIIAMLTIGYQTMRAVRTNPVDSLHYE
ncbi:MAG TPA: ABC transporter permease [bacterium]|nr:ABC transporter permease [bacterium]HPN45865.1 ABC transporter permease [bacterium]